MANIPSPIVIGGGGQQDGPGFVEQLLLTLASQAPQTLMTHLGRKDEQKSLEARGNAAQAGITQLLGAAAADPTLAPLAQSIGAFQTLAPDAQVRAAPDFLTQSQQMMTTLQQRQTARSQQAAADAQTTTTNALRDPQVREARSKADDAYIFAQNRQALIDAELAGQDAYAKAQLAMTLRDNNAAKAEMARAEAAMAEIELRRKEVALGAERADSQAFGETYAMLSETLPLQQAQPAQLRALTSMLIYGTPTPLTPTERRKYYESRLAADGATFDPLAERKQRVMSMITSEFSDFTEDTTTVLDQYLLNANANAQAALNAFVAANPNVSADRKNAAALYLGTVSNQGVRLPEPAAPGWGQRMRKWLQQVPAALPADPRPPATSTPQQVLRDLGIPTP